MLLIIQVGNVKESNIYIRNKKRKLDEAGLNYRHIQCPEDISFERLKHEIEIYACSDIYTAIMLQLPVPFTKEQTQELLDTIPPEKDIDGLNSHSDYIPLTPSAVLRFIDEKVDVKGKICTVLGRSNLVGKPIVDGLIKRGATVISCNSNTKEAQKNFFCAWSHVVVSAVGKPGIVTEKCVGVLKDAIYVDIGTTLVDGHLKGDIGDDAIRLLKRRNIEFTPVPGGVGPMTVNELVNRLKEMEEKAANGI